MSDFIVLSYVKPFSFQDKEESSTRSMSQPVILWLGVTQSGCQERSQARDILTMVGPSCSRSCSRCMVGLHSLVSHTHTHTYMQLSRPLCLTRELRSTVAAACKLVLSPSLGARLTRQCSHRQRTDPRF